jgi:succinyl-CoA synthetase alpha subunit
VIRVAILIEDKTRVLVQGISGRTGSFATRYMVGYGTKVVAGVTPGRKGETIWEVPVYDTVKEASERHGPIDVAITFVPAPAAKEAAIEALNEGIRTIIMPVERVPLHDTLTVIAHSRNRAATVIGPGSMGVISPGKAVAGWIGGAEEVAKVALKPGNVGVISRSGGQTTTVCWNICREGLGISTAVHIGTEPLLGSTGAELLSLFEKDPETHAVAMFGEMGGVVEEEIANAIVQGEYTKPFVIYVAGRSLPAGVRFSHASAIVEGGKGTVESKIKALKNAGAHVVDTPKEIGLTIRKLLKR